MQAIKQLYRIGYGPSSSHTIAPYRIANLYKDNFNNCDNYFIKLCGSLALTAKGHGTINILESIFGIDKLNISFDYETKDNVLEIYGIKNNIKLEIWHGHSLGGGSISIDEYDTHDNDNIYPENNFEEIKKTLNKYNINIIEYVLKYEPDIYDYLNTCIDKMVEIVNRGLNTEGLLNKDLNYYRVAKKLFLKAKDKKDFLVAYSYAACEENAAGGLMVTAPTLGACGILTSLIYYLKINCKIENKLLCEMLMVAGVFGNCIKTNASIAGSNGGCQAEVGTACAMAAAAICYYLGYDLNTIECAAEMGIEHFLGLTCDPVMGYVIIPCIERNAVSVLRAYDCAYLSKQLSDIKKNTISFDKVVSAMNYTGSKIVKELKETSLGGLSLEFKK